LQLESAAATNLHIYSTDFSQATWIKGRGAITSDAKTGLDGNTGNFLFTVNTTSAGGANLRDSNLTAFTAVEHCHWGVFEAGASNWVLLYSYDGSNNQTWFDLSTGAVGTTTGTNNTGIIDLGSGKYLCWHAWTAQVGTTLPSFYVPTGDGTFACQTGDSIYCYHMQCEAGAFPTSPIITNGSTVPRPAEALSIAQANYPTADDATPHWFLIDVRMWDENTRQDWLNLQNNTSGFRLRQEQQKIRVIARTPADGQEGLDVLDPTSTEFTQFDLRLAHRFTTSEHGGSANGESYVSTALTEVPAVPSQDLDLTADDFHGFIREIRAGLGEPATTDLEAASA